MSPRQGTFVAPFGRVRHDGHVLQVISRVPVVALGLGVEAASAGLRMARVVGHAMQVAADAATRPAIARVPLGRLDAALASREDRSRAALARVGESFGAYAVGSVQRTVAMTVSVLPMREIVDALPVGEIVAKVDVEALLERVDVDAIVRRVDVAAIIERVDIAGVVADVLEEIDIRSIVRESTATVAGQSIDVVRTQAMGADALAARIVDRLLSRRRSRVLDLASPIPIT